MAEVKLHGAKAAGRTALVDDADLELVSRYRWSYWEQLRPGCKVHGPYALASFRRGGRVVTIRMHNLVTGRKYVDHANGDGLDNRRQNLRPATHGQNQANTGKRPGTTSRFIGVCWRHGKWVAKIKNRYLGRFTDEAEAARARDRAATEMYGEFARLNFPAETGR